MKTRERAKSRAEQKNTSELVNRSLLYTRESKAIQSEQSQKVSSKMKKVLELAKEIKAKIEKYSKLAFNQSSHHECEFNRASYLDDKFAFSVSDKKYYKNTERTDTLTMSREQVENRLKAVALFDREAFEKAFEYEATFILCCNSKAVALNLTHHERKYSTLFRHLALYSHRADLYLLSMMSDKQRETAFNSSHFERAVEIQAKALTIEQIKKATCSNKLYEKAVEQLKKLLIAMKSSKVEKAKVATVKMIKAKAIEKKVKVVTK